MKKTTAAQSNIALTHDELSVFCWQLAQLCRAGVSWQDAADLLWEDADEPRQRAVLSGLRRGLGSGLPLSAALAGAGTFPPYLLRMVEIGQAAGRVDEVLAALSDYYKREAATAQAVRRAVTYPAVMAALIALVFLVLVLRVLPVFGRVFAQLGAGLSPVAAALLQVGSAGRYVAGGLALLLLLAAVAALFFFHRGGGAPLFSRGAAALSVARGRFASAMALMLQSGLPLREAMDRSAQLLEGSPLDAPVALCLVKMAGGTAFPKAAEESGLFTGMEAGLLSAGFRTGVPEAAMAELAQRCGSDGEARMERALARFEYALVLLLCLSVGLVLLSVMLPLLGMLAAVG